LRRFDPTSLLDRLDVVGSRFAETLEIELLDERGQWQFPRLLLVVIDLAQFRRVQPKLSSHLYLAVRQMVVPSRIDPFLHLAICFDFLRHKVIVSSPRSNIPIAPRASTIHPNGFFIFIGPSDFCGSRKSSWKHVAHFGSGQMAEGRVLPSRFAASRDSRASFSGV
jgi:hypothetical protein